MKTIQIDFVRSTHWRTIWALAGLGIAGLVFVYLPPYWTQYQSKHAIDQSSALLRQQATPLAAPATTQTDPRLANSQQAALVLKRNLNGVFALTESLQEPTLRLYRLSIDNVAGAVQLEYEFDTMLRVSSVTLALNAGYPAPPWRLDSVTPIVLGNSVQAGLPATLFRALWRAELDKL